MIVIFDYGCGNLYSLQSALDALNLPSKVTTDPLELVDAQVVVLPGVGQFGAVMEALEPARQILQERHAQGKPILGICVGMQAMFEGSEEAPERPGLSLFEGHVQRLPEAHVLIPHMGWNTLTPQATDAPWSAILPTDRVYFVHSYAVPSSPAATSTCSHGDPFVASVAQGETVGLQFHPEKSGALGLRILSNVMSKWVGA